MIPALYLERVATRSTHAERRHRLRALSRQLLEPLGQPDHPLNALSAIERARLEQVAGDCADLFSAAVPRWRVATVNCPCIIMAGIV